MIVNLVVDLIVTLVAQTTTVQAKNRINQANIFGKRG